MIELIELDCIYTSCQQALISCNYGNIRRLPYTVVFCAKEQGFPKQGNEPRDSCTQRTNNMAVSHSISLKHGCVIADLDESVLSA